MRKLGASVLPVPLLCALIACRALAGAANDIDITDDFEGGTLLDPAKWEKAIPQQEPQGVKIEAGRLTLGDDYAAGRADLKLEMQTKKKLTFTAKRVSLSSGGMYRRSMTLRVTRGTDTIWGTVRVYKQKRDDPDTVQIAIGKFGSTDPVTWADASSVAIDGTEDLVLEFTGTNGEVSFGSVAVPLSGSVANESIALCRVEVQGNPYVQARPSIDEISAKTNP